jgi:hypothetical protein
MLKMPRSRIVPNHSAFRKRNDSPRDSFKFQKRGQLFIRTHNKTFSVIAMCVSDKNGSATSSS